MAGLDNDNVEETMSGAWRSLVEQKQNKLS